MLAIIGNALDFGLKSILFSDFSLYVKLTHPEGFSEAKLNYIGKIKTYSQDWSFMVILYLFFITPGRCALPEVVKKPLIAEAILFTSGNVEQN